MAGRVIFHIDLNSFFASAEVLKNSALEGQPVVVAGMHRRSVVSTASYEARNYGVHSAMPLHMALEKCPQLVVVQGDYAWYEELSIRFFNYVKRFSPYLEPASIDECYIDVTEAIRAYKRPLDLAWRIQKGVYEDLRLPCSIGVGPNKFLAKMASDMRKPMGITVLRRQEIERKLWPLSIADMFGIGKKTVPLLERQGIYTIGDFANPANEAKIMALMGKHAYQLIQNARGFGSNRLDYNTSVQSISQSTTLDTNIVEYEEVKSVFKRLANKLSQRAKQEDLRGALISISIRYADFTNAVRSTTISEYTNDADVLLEHALLLFDQHNNGKEIRHLGIGLGSLFSKMRTVDQINLFQDVKAEPTDSTDILKQLNKQLSTGKLMKASELLKK
ncbi:DNA polymerase IV [Amedibacillus dolichus]|uniref:DNA polymerase IV n=3 Tax=Amedibacillus dolichus TaxID=31971 RepID=A0A415P9P4_9FIRM|nr:DNA polymerase IV [Amedibacillus dolichus]MCB5373017.1 DNA polymerase IV [Amedibacillus dolichus]RHM09484.1 DNA polymerase IV [Amedibacillus dolichus]